MGITCHFIANPDRTFHEHRKTQIFNMNKCVLVVAVIVAANAMLVHGQSMYETMLLANMFGGQGSSGSSSGGSASSGGLSSLLSGGGASTNPLAGLMRGAGSSSTSTGPATTAQLMSALSRSTSGRGAGAAASMLMPGRGRQSSSLFGGSTGIMAAMQGLSLDQMLELRMCTMMYGRMRTMSPLVANMMCLNRVQ